MDSIEIVRGHDLLCRRVSVLYLPTLISYRRAGPRSVARLPSHNRGSLPRNCERSTETLRARLGKSVGSTRYGAEYVASTRARGREREGERGRVGHPDRGARKFSKGTVRSSGSLLPYRSSRGNITRLILPGLGGRGIERGCERKRDPGERARRSGESRE